jgi:hypothetical protein
MLETEFGKEGGKVPMNLSWFWSTCSLVMALDMMDG